MILPTASGRRVLATLRPLLTGHVGLLLLIAVAGVATAFAFTLEPFRQTLSFGQINIYLGLLVLVDLLVLGRRGSKWTGIGIGLATAIKLTPGIFIIYLLVVGRWRAAITAMPCRPTSPDSRMTSPTRTLEGATTASCSMSPMPAVLMYNPSPFPRSTTLVSPVTSSTPAATAADCMDCTTRCSTAIGRPSSMVRNRALVKCWYGPLVRPNQASLVMLSSHCGLAPGPVTAAGKITS